MQLPDRLRLPFTFDPDRLAGDLRGLSAVGWTEHFVRQNYDGDWSVIEGAFFENWSDAGHFCPPFQIPRGWVRFRSMDWGSTR